MGALISRVGLDMLVNGNGLADNFKKNSLSFYQKFNKSDESVKAIDVADIIPGMFYQFHYLDTSNWMKWSPVFVTNFKKIGNQTIIFAVNFNFIPLEVRPYIFDDYINEEDFENNRPIKVTYERMYEELLRIGFEYSLVEYDARLIKRVHRIEMETVPEFLISQHPQNKYDPGGLRNIWSAKIKTRDKRNQEMMNSSLKDFFEIKKDISEKYKVLRGHLQRIQNNQKKFGNL